MDIIYFIINLLSMKELYIYKIGISAYVLIFICKFAEYEVGMQIIYKHVELEKLNLR